MSETGLLLINLGTPTAPETGPVRAYLREFLSDPRVLDMNPIGRALLLNLIILPFRPAKSARAYREIWDAQRGSPLMFHSVALAEAVSRELGQGFRVRLAMRYGHPLLIAPGSNLGKRGPDSDSMQAANSRTPKAVTKDCANAGCTNKFMAKQAFWKFCDLCRSAHKAEKVRT